MTEKKGKKKTMAEKRVGDRDRDKVSDYLRECFAGGYLTRPELEERLSTVVTARTRKDLDGLLDDMPGEEELTGQTVKAVAEKKVPQTTRMIRFGRLAASAAEDHPGWAALLGILISTTIAVVPPVIIYNISPHGQMGILTAPFIMSIIIGVSCFFATMFWVMEETL